MAILITGGTKGIGLAIAKRFAKPGDQVFMNYHSDEDSAHAAREEIEGRGASAYVIKQDVSTPAGAKALIDAVAKETERLDQIVHCAVRILADPLLSVDLDAFTQAVNLNGTAIVYLVQHAKPLLGKGSTVFFLSSKGSRTVVPNYAALGAPKALAEALVRYLAQELAPLGVRANCIAPGTLDTEALRRVFGDKTDAYLEEAAKSSPSGRNLTHDDYTGLIEFLAGREAEMIQGQVIFVNGGQYLAP